MPPKNLSFLLIFVLFLAACSENDPIKPNVDLNIPSNYEFVRDGESTVSFSGQTTRISMATELIDAMTDPNKTEMVLLEMYANQTADGGDANPYTGASLNESTKSVKSKVAASTDYFSSNSVESAAIKADIESWIKAQVTEVYPNWNQLASAGQAGQIADGSTARYVNAGGLEYDQAVNKSLIGALMLDQINNNYLSSSVLDAGDNIANNDAGIVDTDQAYTAMEHKWDEAYGYLFGAQSANHTDPIQTLGGDSFLNKYLSRVEDDSDFAGIAQEIIDAFTKGRAAIVAGEYQIRDEQAAIIRDKLNQVIAIRAIFYLQSGKNALAAQDMGAAFHDLSEGFGFVYSLRFMRDPSGNPFFDRSDIEGFINDLTAGYGFWDIEEATLNRMSNTIADYFEFTVEMAAG